MNKRKLMIQLSAVLLTAIGFAADAGAQQGIRRFECVGYVNGVASQALLEITPGGVYTEGPGVAGRISNQFADYTFSLQNSSRVAERFSRIYQADLHG